MDLEAFLTIIRAKSPLIFLNEILRIPLEDIAGEIGVTQSFLSHVKAGKRPLSARQATDLGKLLSRALDKLEEQVEPDPAVDALLSAIIEYGEEL